MMNDSRADYLASCVQTHLIMMDTSSLLSEHVGKFWRNMIPILKLQGKRVILSKSVMKEVQRHADNPERCRIKYPNNPRLNETAKRTLDDVERLIRDGVVEVRADPDEDKLADNVLLSVIVRFRMQYNILLITEDRGLAEEALKQGKDNRAVKGIKSILVKRLTSDGCLRDVFDKRSFPSDNGRGVIPPQSCFRVVTAVSDVPDAAMTVSLVPGQGDEVVAVRGADRKTLRLGEILGHGGEGIVYRTNIPGIVAKIYFKDKIKRHKYEKLKLMLTKELDCEGICLPMAMIFNTRNEFVGYLMRQAEGQTLKKFLFRPLPEIQKRLSDWKKTDSVQLCITILEKLKYLHDRNIVLGDINELNILIASPTKVYFVDTDSYQVEGFPCLVGTAYFTAPEIQRQRPALLSVEQDLFAVATLLFMIMLPGKPPYAMQGGADDFRDNIIEGDFSYPFKEQKNGKVPPGRWRYIWSHLSYDIKCAFYHSFRRDDGEHYAPERRYRVDEWLELFHNYHYALTKGKMRETDEMSLELLPIRFKRQEGKTYATCRTCGREDDEERMREGLCPVCFRERRNTCYQRRTCTVCGNSFEITHGERDYYDDKNLDLPKRCPECRKGRTTGHGRQEESVQEESLLEMLFKSLFK